MYLRDFNIMKTTDNMKPPMYATIYINFQKITNLYTPEEALANGTIFPELNMPYQYNPNF